MLKDNKSAKLNVLKVKEKWSDLLSLALQNLYLPKFNFLLFYPNCLLCRD